MVDSGADECIYPAWIVKMLGHKVYKGKQKILYNALVDQC